MYRRNSLLDDMFRMARRFDNPMVFRTLPERSKHSCGSCYPAVDIMKGDSDFVLRAELPGVDPEKVDVELENGRLVLRGEKNGENGQQIYHREAYRGKFERSFNLPEEVKSDEISASFRNGVLEIVIPMNGARKPLRIPVDTGEKN